MRSTLEYLVRDDATGDHTWIAATNPRAAVLAHERLKCPDRQPGMVARTIFSLAGDILDYSVGLSTLRGPKVRVVRDAGADVAGV